MAVVQHYEGLGALIELDVSLFFFFFPKWNDCWQDTGTSGSVAAGLFSNSGKWAAFVPLLPTLDFFFKFPLPGSVLFLQRCRGAVKMFFQLQGRTRIMGWLSNSSVGIVAGLRKREKAQLIHRKLFFRLFHVWVRWATYWWCNTCGLRQFDINLTKRGQA